MPVGRQHAAQRSVAPVFDTLLDDRRRGLDVKWVKAAEARHV
jgi:hypothetical protein